jgi:hypothetical protein
MYEVGSFLKTTLNLGKPSRDKMFDFMTETDKRARANKSADGVPDKDDLSRISKVLYSINREAPVHWFIVGHCYENCSISKYISLHKDMGGESGLVYHGPMVKTHSRNALPHHYGEFAYRYVGGSIYYAGYFDHGIPSGECRVSIEGIKDCYGTMRGSNENGVIRLRFFPSCA